MRYWVYINEKVEGPYEETDLVTLPGFTPETLICTEEAASAGRQEWQKASSVFEFDEVPVDNASNSLAVSGHNTIAQTPVPSGTGSIDTEVLLEKLNSLSQEMSNLQTKLDFMQTHLDSALEQNKQLAEQAAAAAQAAHEMSQQQQKAEEVADDPANTQTETADKVEPADYPSQADPQEDEVVIRSALDSIYGGKTAENEGPQEDAFQELLPSREQKTAEEIGQELEFIPMPDDNPSQNLPEALVTTPSLDEASKDALISELTASSQEDVLDQIIQEHQADSQAEKSSAAGVAAGVVGAGLAAGAAALAQHEAEKSSESFEIAPDKNNPEQLESVLPAAQMPADVPANETSGSEEEFVDLPGLEDTLQEINLTEVDPAADTNSVAAQEETPETVEEIFEQKETVEQTEEPEVAPIDFSDLADSVSQTISQEHKTADEQMPAQTEEPVAEPTEVPSLQEISAEDVKAETLPENDPVDWGTEEKAEDSADLPGLADVNNPAFVSNQTAEEMPSEKADLPSLDEMGQSPSQEEEQPSQPVDTFKQPELEFEEIVARSKDSSEDGLVSEADVAAVSLKSPEELMEPMVVETSLPQEPAAESLEEPTESKEQAQPENRLEENAEAESIPEIARPSLDELELATVLSDTVTAPGESTELMPAGNPNELTEIELKEGSTYLISDFVPPAQLTEDAAEVMGSRETNAAEMPASESQQEDAFQDILASPANQEGKETSGNNSPQAGAAGNLENTIQAKRGASLDIKTVPMVAEPGKDRVNVDDLNDVNVQHDVKKASHSTKTILGVLVGGVLLIIIYVLLGLMHILPDSINLLGGKKQAAQPVAAESAESVQELLPVEESVPEEQVPAETETTAQESAVNEAQAKVQEFPLPNGYLLREFIASKHPLAEADEVIWTTTEAVEADNYSVSVKVPPDNPQGLQTAYRFNYNMTTGILNPTNSDAKNLLDQAYGTVQKPATSTAKKKTSRRTSRK